MAPTTLLQSRQDGLAYLQTCLTPHTPTPQQDAQVVLAHILGLNRASLLAFPERTIPPQHQPTVAQAAEKLAAGMPLPYVLGQWEFYGRHFQVTPDVLIPRPETEHLVETALEWLSQHPSQTNIVDIGTGSGCIAVTLACEHSTAQITAVDISPPALRIAAENAARHNVGHRIQFLKSNLLSNLTHPVDLICANLPYIRTADLHSLAIHGREPTLALDGGPDGLRLIDQLLQQAPSMLSPGGCVLLEIDATNGPDTLALARARFPQAEVHLRPDLAGRDRLIIIQEVQK